MQKYTTNTLVVAYSMNLFTKTLDYYEKNGLSKTLQKALTTIYFDLFVNRLKYFGLTYVPSRYGFSFKKNWGDFTFRLYINAAYGFFLFDYLAERDSAYVFFDIGANQGIYTLAAEKNPHCQKVYAFEPVSKTYSFLSSNVVINVTSDKVNLVNAAISDNHGTCEIVIKEGHSGGATTAEQNATSGQAEKIKMINSEELNKFSIPRNTDIVVKIDVEGHEQVVIEELTKLRYWPRIVAIFYEVDKRWSESSQIEQVLRDNEFNSFESIGDDKNQYDVLASRP